MNIENRINAFLELNFQLQLDSWRELLSIGKDFLLTENKNCDLAKKIAEAIENHRSLMGSSKAYESAFEIDVELVDVSLRIARIAYGHSKKLDKFLKSGIYYSDVTPERFNKLQLEEEQKNLSD